METALLGAFGIASGVAIVRAIVFAALALIPIWSDICAFRAAGLARGAAAAWLASWLGTFLFYGAGMGMSIQSSSAGLAPPLVAGVLLALSLACGVVGCVLALMREFKLSGAFGHGAGMWLLLVLPPPVGNMVLGYGPSEYVLGEGGL